MTSMCYICASSFGLFNKEKGCPSCGLSVCTKCLIDPAKSKHSKKESKICRTCFNKSVKNLQRSEDIEVPKNLLLIENKVKKNKISTSENKVLEDRLKNLKDSANSEKSTQPNDASIRKRLDNLKQNTDNSTKINDASIRKRLDDLQPSTAEVPSTKEIMSRLAALKNETSSGASPLTSSSVDPTSVLDQNEPKSEQQQIKDLLSLTTEEVKAAKDRGDDDDDNDDDEDDEDDEDAKAIRLTQQILEEDAIDERVKNFYKQTEQQEINDLMKKATDEVKIAKKQDIRDCDDDELEYRIRQQILEDKSRDEKLEEDLEDEKWCCMCNKDAEIICKLCLDDYYCKTCYRKGHKSELYRDHFPTTL